MCSVRDSSWVTTAVNERGDGTVVAGRAYLLRCTSFLFYDCIPNTTEKRRRVFPFSNNHRRPSQILTTLLLTFFSTFSIRPSKIFLFLQRLSSLFFYFYYMALHSLVSLLPDRSRMPPFFVSESDKINNNLCVKAIFVSFSLIEAISFMVKVNGLVHKESC